MEAMRFLQNALGNVLGCVFMERVAGEGTRRLLTSGRRFARGQWGGPHAEGWVRRTDRLQMAPQSPGNAAEFPAHQDLPNGKILRGEPPRGSPLLLGMTSPRKED